MEWFRQCWYTDKERHFIWLENHTIEAPDEQSALADLLEKYKDIDNIACMALQQGEDKIEE